MTIRAVSRYPAITARDQRYNGENPPVGVFLGGVADSEVVHRLSSSAPFNDATDSLPTGRSGVNPAIDELGAIIVKDGRPDGRPDWGYCMTSTSNPLTSLGRLRRDAPKTVAGFSRFRTVIDTDGALPTRIKRLFVACAASVKGYTELAARELSAARDVGLGEDEAGAAVAILSSVRGEGAALRFEALFRDAYGAIDPVVSDEPVTVAPGEAERNFLRYFGTMPPSLGKLLALNPLAADAYYLMREGTLSGTRLDPAHAELLLVTVLTADYSNWASVHMTGARKAGASEEAIAEAVICAVPTSGLSAWVVGATAMDA